MRSSNTALARTRALLAPVLVGGLALAACGGDDDDTTTTSSSPTEATAPAASTTPPAPGTSGTAASADFNDADVEFVQNMIAHHKQAIEMAVTAQDPARQAGADVLDLAARIEGAQDPEIETMTGWLTAWGEPVEVDMSDGGHDMSSTTGMMSAEDMDALAAASGAEFDEMWLTMMVEHHQGAIEMATGIQAEGANPDVTALAAQIVTAQQAEVDEMTGLLGS